ncbi:hypothetical protein CCACVL1_29300 [Corchorus capsularis]|uniref:Uncharacterized protein n=1 Tax=Corchorus capsularis TaxID=210143 RepID=A0A1R3G2C4_COCAP|nr:hypothetical protein CCACVL1_29300 [Corchorus capsularis]
MAAIISSPPAGTRCEIRISPS